MSIFKKRDSKNATLKNKSPMQNAQSIKSYLKNNVDVYCYDTIDSTNSEAKRYAENNDYTSTLFVAQNQTNGRGRLGRSFYSPHNTGLYMSLLLKVNDDTDNVLKLTTATAVNVCESLENLCDVSPKIKWVNDIYLEGKKVCGILCEAITSQATHKIDAVVVGIGINLSTENFPDELKDVACSVNKDVNKDKLCADITDRLISSLENINSDNFIDKYKARSLVLGKEIFYISDGVTKSATAMDIDKNGGLVIKTDDGTKTLSTGEITVRLK